MAAFELVLNPRKSLKRSDVIKMGKLISKVVKKKDINMLVVKITDDAKGGANTMQFPFLIVDEK
jgi:hypothetical protein